MQSLRATVFNLSTISASGEAEARNLPTNISPGFGTKAIHSNPNSRLVLAGPEGRQFGAILCTPAFFAGLIVNGQRTLRQG